MNKNAPCRSREEVRKKYPNAVRILKGSTLKQNYGHEFDTESTAKKVLKSTVKGGLIGGAIGTAYGAARTMDKLDKVDMGELKESMLDDCYYKYGNQAQACKVIEDTSEDKLDTYLKVPAGIVGGIGGGIQGTIVGAGVGALVAAIKSKMKNKK